MIPRKGRQRYYPSRPVPWRKPHMRAVKTPRGTTGTPYVGWTGRAMIPVECLDLKLLVIASNPPVKDSNPTLWAPIRECGAVLLSLRERKH